MVFASVATLVFLLILYFSAFANVSAYSRKNAEDESGHVLVSKWKKYEKISDEDLPVTKEKILGDIISEAYDRHLSWDFFDALDKYYDACVSRNWKRRDSVKSFLSNKVLSYDDVMVTYRSSSFLPVEVPSLERIDSAAILKGRKIPQFYSDGYLASGGVLSFPELLLDRISSDYEYLLWSYWYRLAHVSSPQYDKVSEMLDKQLSDRYPEAAFKKLVTLLHQGSDDRDRCLQKFVDDYDTKAVSYFAKGLLLESRFGSMKTDPRTASEDYVSLKKDCKEYISQISALAGDERALLKDFTIIDELVEELDRKHMEFSTGKDSIRIYLNNIPYVEVSVKAVDEAHTEVFSRKLENHIRSYYMTDTLSVDISALDDGEYELELKYKDIVSKSFLSKYTLSAAGRYNDGVFELYVADYISGKPVPAVDIEVMEKECKVWSASNVLLNGLTPLDKSLGDSLSGEPDRAFFRCSYRDSSGVMHSCKPFCIYEGSSTMQSDMYNDGWYGHLLTSMSAVHPGDSVYYKAIVFSSANGGGYQIVPEGEKTVVSLYDSENSLVVSDTLTVNDFGSVSGGFEIPCNRRNGTYRIVLAKAEDTGNVIASSFVLADDFTMPSYHLKFDPQEHVYFRGDTVSVGGVLKSYSSHPLSAATVSYKVSAGGDIVASGNVSVEDDGRFVIEFPTENQSDSGRLMTWYSVVIRVSDVTGETKEFFTGISVSEFFYLKMTLENEAEVEINPGKINMDVFASDTASRYEVKIVEGDFAVVSFNIWNISNKKFADDQFVDYELAGKEGVVASGKVPAGEKLWIDLSVQPSGVYRLKARFCIRGRVREYKCDLMKVSEDDDVLDLPLENMFRYIYAPGKISFQMGSAAGPVWAVASLSGGGKVLASELVYLKGVMSESGSLETLSFDYMNTYPDVVRLDVFYFRNEQMYSYSREYRRVAEELPLPLSFSRFTDKANSGQECIYEISTLPGVECAVAVYDKAVDQIRNNIWRSIRKVSVNSNPVPISFSRGQVYGRRIYIKGNSGVLSKEQSFYSLEDKASAEHDIIREDFDSQLAFYPYLRSDKDGKVAFSFEAGDKLSEYYVSVFAHDKSLRNNVIRKSVTVSLPVRLSVMEPLYLYDGDLYKVNVSVSNISDMDSEGTLTACFYDGTDYENDTPVMAVSHPVKVRSGSSVADCFETEAFDNIDTLGLKIVYRATQGYSDGVFVKIPVRKAVQTIREAHSSVWLGEESEDSLYAKLRKEFVNVSGYGAESEEISIYKMLSEGLAESSSAVSGDAISLSSALYSSVLRQKEGISAGAESGSVSARTPEELLSRLMALRNADGGFAWFEGMRSSQTVTAVVLERLYKISKIWSGISADNIALSLKYVDQEFFKAYSTGRTDRLSVSQYLYLRSLYDGYGIETGYFKSVKTKFKADFKRYFQSSENSSVYHGYILGKARRAATFSAFMHADDCSDKSALRMGNVKSAFLESVGIKLTSRMKAVYSKDMSSLREYAVAHVSGGVYYPNAVLPFRGLLESELYAHAFLSELMSSHGQDWSEEIADGIRLWIMVQKESQCWNSDAAYCEALSAVSKASDKIKSAKVLTLRQAVEKPLDKIVASGNAMTVQARWYREDGNEGKYVEITNNDTLKVGDKVKVVCDVWSQENRSFVRLSIPRHACLRPQNQISGYSFGSGYREVRADRSMYYLDLLPEEKSRFEEVFFVTQSGSFTVPVVEIESMYANYFRANDKFSQKIFAE